MILEKLLHLILLILVLIVILKCFLESNFYNQYLKTQIQKLQLQSKEAFEMNKVITTARNDATQKINSVIEESFVNLSSNTNGNREYITSYLNRSNKIKLELYYKLTCPHCKNFMPVWTRIINDLPNDATYEEIDVEKNMEKATENNITSIPTIILLVNNEKKIYMGDRSYNDINTFLRTNGINLIQRTFEQFNTVPQPTSGYNPHCPTVTFDKQIDLENDSYLYQIFNSDGQYGYASGGNNPDKVLTPFQAAYSTVDSYLSSLPDNTNPLISSYKNIDECAKLYNNQIINFGLCDIDQLNAIQGYQSNVASGMNNPLIDGTDYSNNTKVVNAIRNVCGFN